jgi:unsaturated chondroitin disaccharide hydrolase
VPGHTAGLFRFQLEWLEEVEDRELVKFGTKINLKRLMLKAAKATCDFYIENTPVDGVPYWDTGAPELYRIVNYLEKPADPFNSYEPVDSSAAAIASQGLLRLGNYLTLHDETEAGKRYWQSGLRVIDTLLDVPYLSTNANHHGLLLHSVYHRPNGWDYIPQGSKIPNGESSMWGDYHIREACLYLQRVISDENYYTYFSCVK